MEWSKREAVVLEAIADFEASGEKPKFDQLVTRSGLSRKAAEFGFQALLDDGYVDGIDARSHSGYDYLEIRLLPLGREALGQWPSAGHLSLDDDLRMELFISHSSEDADAAAALIDFLTKTLEIPDEEVRCTSVDGYRLPGGADTKQQLRREVSGATAFVALMSPASLKSSFVLFELGARWGAKKHLVPLTIRGIKPGDLPSPLSDLNALDTQSDSQLHQLVDNLGDKIGRSPVAPHVYQSSLARFKEEQSKPVIEPESDLNQTQLPPLSNAAVQVLRLYLEEDKTELFMAEFEFMLNLSRIEIEAAIDELKKHKQLQPGATVRGGGNYILTEAGKIRVLKIKKGWRSVIQRPYTRPPLITANNIGSLGNNSKCTHRPRI